jgi:hypothetical protein
MARFLLLAVSCLNFYYLIVVSENLYELDFITPGGGRSIAMDDGRSAGQVTSSVF